MKKLFAVLVLILSCSATYGKIINPSDSLIDADKKIVVAKTVHLVFQNYANKIDSLKKYFTPQSIMTFIDTYNREEAVNIEARIANKFYVQQFATTEKQWMETDYAEVAALTKKKTVDRISEIMKEVDVQVSGLYAVTDDKIRCLAKEIKAEIK